MPLQAPIGVLPSHLFLHVVCMRSLGDFSVSRETKEVFTLQKYLKREGLSPQYDRAKMSALRGRVPTDPPATGRR